MLRLNHNLEPNPNPHARPKNARARRETSCSSRYSAANMSSHQHTFAGVLLRLNARPSLNPDRMSLTLTQWRSGRRAAALGTRRPALPFHQHVLARLLSTQAFHTITSTLPSS